MSPRERKLLVIFCVTIFIIVNLLILPRLLRLRTQMESDLVLLRSQRDESRFWLGEKDLWLSRGKWLADKTPQFENEGAANTALLETIQKGAAQRKIEITDVNVVDAVEHGRLKETAVKLNAVGPSKQMIEWIHELQQPGNLQGVKELSVKVEEDRKRIRCQLNIIRFYTMKAR